MLAKLLAIPASLALIAVGSMQPAQALLTYNIFETTDGNVVVQTDGFLNLPNPIGSKAECGADGRLWSSIATICTGRNEALPLYRIAGPALLNGSVFIVPASSVSGLSTSLVGVSELFGISSTYVSGDPIISSATYNNTTLKGLGFTTTGLIGTWTLAGTGDQIQVVLTEVPGPLPLVGAGAAFAFSRKLRRRIAASPATPPQA